MSFLPTSPSSEAKAGETNLSDGGGQKILISRLSAHGDVVQTLPLLVWLKSKDPSIFVGWVVEESAAPLLLGHPMIDRLHVFKRKQWFQAMRRPTAWPQIFREFGAFLNAVRQEKYTVGVDVQGLLKSASLLWLAKIPRRIGYHRTRENASLFYTETIPHHEMRHPDIPTVAIFAEFARKLGYEPPTREEASALLLNGEALPYSFVVPPASEQTQAKVRELMAPLQGKGPVIAIAPETIWPSKHWIPDYWKTALRHCARQGYPVVFVGSAGAESMARDWVEQMGDPSLTWLNLAGKTVWEDLYELFRHVDVLIGLDSAPLHIANAVGHSRIVGIYGPTGVRRTGPIGLQHRGLSAELSCQPCFRRQCPLGTHECMQVLGPEQVVEALESVLAESALAVQDIETSCS